MSEQSENQSSIEQQIMEKVHGLLDRDYGEIDIVKHQNNINISDVDKDQIKID